MTPLWSEQVAARSAELGSLQAVWDEVRRDLDARAATAEARAAIVREAVRRTSWLAEHDGTPPWERPPFPPAPSGVPAPPAQWSNRLAGVVRAVATATPGNRNAALYWAALTLAEAEAPRDEVSQALAEAALVAGLGEVETRATIASAYRRVGS